jgi:predicted RNase H-like nuclease (RuvC/YqgF family)
VLDSTGTLSNERLQDLKRELRDEVVASLKAEIEKRERSFSMLSTMYIDMKTELEQTKARCSELEKKVETMDLKSRESDEKIENSLILESFNNSLIEFE